MNVVKEKYMELCLCKRCLEGFFSTKKYHIRRLNPIEVIREPCVLCQVGSGYDFVIEPRRVRTQAKAMRREPYVINRAG